MHATEWGGGLLRVVRPPSGVLPRHSHDEYVISVNLCGLERVRLDRTSFDVNLDEFTAYDPGQVQSRTTQVAPDASFASVSWYVPPTMVESLTGDASVDNVDKERQMGIRALEQLMERHAVQLSDADLLVVEQLASLEAPAVSGRDYDGQVLYYREVDLTGLRRLCSAELKRRALDERS